MIGADLSKKKRGDISIGKDRNRRSVSRVCMCEFPQVVMQWRGEREERGEKRHNWTGKRLKKEDKPVAKETGICGGRRDQKWRFKDIEGKERAVY